MIQSIQSYPWLLLLLWEFILSVILFVMMSVDKIRAISGKRRIPERRLFLFAVLGGAIGGTLGMFSFRHKTRHWKFMVFFPLLAIGQFAALFLFAVGLLPL